MVQETVVNAAPVTVPFGVRLRLAAGFRVPSAYRQWALGEIQSEGWPVRQGVTRMVILVFPSSSFGAGITSLLLRGHLPMSPLVLLFSFLFFPLMSLAIGIVMGAGWPNWVRERAITYQLKEKVRR